MANNKCIQSQSKYSFVNFMNDIITQLHKNGQHKTWQHYRATLNSFMRFRQNKDLSLRKMDAAMMEAYEVSLSSTWHISKNPTSKTAISIITAARHTNESLSNGNRRCKRW